jgi:peroxiredoxin Q/BCP
MTLTIGSAAPDFTLESQDGTRVALGDFRGKQPIVLIFYPGDMTPGCTKQLCIARDDAPQYAAAGIAVFGVNSANADSHKKFVAKHGLTTPLLVDRGFVASDAYGSLLKLGPIKITNRTVVGIDTQGRIAYYKRGMPSTSEILAAMSVAAR